MGARNRSNAPLLSRSATCRRTSPARVAAGVRHSGDLGGLPDLPFVLVRNPKDSAVGLHRQQIENAVVVGVRDGDGFDRRQASGQRALAGIVPGDRFMKTCSCPAPSMIAASGLPSPSRSAQANPSYAGNSVKGMNRAERFHLHYFASTVGVAGLSRPARYRDRRRLQCPPPTLRCSGH